MKQIKIARIVTVPIAFVHIKAFLLFLKNKPEVSVELISSDGLYRDVIKRDLNLDINILPIKREISLFSDLRSLFDLIMKFFSEDYQIIHSSTPKAGLLVAIAGIFFPRAIKIHTFTGQRWATIKSKPLKGLLKKLDWLIIKLNNQCYADSHSQIKFLISEGVALENEIKCINLGSYGGIDTTRFDNLLYPDAHVKLCSEIKCSADSVLFLFIGRLTKDKGVEELILAFELAQKKMNNIELVLVGPFEAEVDQLTEEVFKKIQINRNIHQLGFKSNPEFYFSGSDVFCLPSYREGFGTVVLEAAACEVMTIGTRIPGLVDSVVDGETGLLVELKNIQELSQAMIRVVEDKELRLKLSRNAKVRASKEFDAKYLARLQWEEYIRLLKKHS